MLSGSMPGVASCRCTVSVRRSLVRTAPSHRVPSVGLPRRGASEENLSRNAHWKTICANDTRENLQSMSIKKNIINTTTGVVFQSRFYICAEIIFLYECSSDLRFTRRLTYDRRICSAGGEDLEKPIGQRPFAGYVFFLLSWCGHVAGVWICCEGYPGDRSQPDDPFAGLHAAFFQA